MVAGYEPLNREDLIGSECAEDVSDPQRLWIAVEDDIGPSNSAERYQGLLLVYIAVNVCPEKETVW